MWCGEGNPMIPDRKYCTSVDFEMGFYSTNIINPKKVKLTSTWVTKNFWVYAGTWAALLASWHTEFFNPSYWIGFENDRAREFYKEQQQKINLKNGKIWSLVKKMVLFSDGKNRFTKDESHFRFLLLTLNRAKVEMLIGKSVFTISMSQEMV